MNDYAARMSCKTDYHRLHVHNPFVSEDLRSWYTWARFVGVVGEGGSKRIIQHNNILTGTCSGPWVNRLCHLSCNLISGKNQSFRGESNSRAHNYFVLPWKKRSVLQGKCKSDLPRGARFSLLNNDIKKTVYIFSTMQINYVLTWNEVVSLAGWWLGMSF